MIKVFIPIKEHSSRVPRKNFREFGGKPLYQYVLSKYKECTKSEIWVDTDSCEIYDWVNKICPENFHSYMRSETLIGDDVSVNLLIDYFVSEYCEDGDVIIQTHVTSPFLSANYLEQLVDILEEKNLDSIASANVIQSRLWREEGYGLCPINHNPLKMEKTQDLPKLYEENSSFYVFTVESFKKNRKRIGLNHDFYEIKFPKNVDIDNEDDFNMALAVRRFYEE
jgi:CMP-N-acetylneuraminic acid synthetase